MGRLGWVFELARQLGILFVFSVLITYFGKLILLSTPTIDWKASTLLALVFWFFGEVLKVLKRGS